MHKLRESQLVFKLEDKNIINSLTSIQGSNDFLIHKMTSQAEHKYKIFICPSVSVKQNDTVMIGTTHMKS